MAKASKSPLATPLDIDEDLHFRALAGRLNQLRTDRKKCDLIIKVEGKEIHVHRNVMMAGSDYFDAMFSHDTLENSTGVVEMKDVTFSIVKKLVVFIYTGKIFIIEEECDPLLFAARLMQLTTVCEKIVQFLHNRLSPVSFFNARRIANKFSLKILKKICDDYALENLHLLAKEAEFNDLEVNYIKFLCSAENYDEDSKLAIVLQWIKADIENRRQGLIQLTSLLNLAKISPACGKYIAEEEEICSSSLEFMRMLYLSGLKQSNTKPKPPFIDSGHVAKADSIIVFDKSSGSLQAFEPESRSWKKMHNLHEDMLGDAIYTAVVVKQFVYVMMDSKELYRLDITKENSTWARMADMLEERSNGGATVHDWFIYVLDDNGLEKYEIKKNKWIKVNFEGLDESALVECDGSIYSIGGWNGGVSNIVNCFSPTSSSWSHIRNIKVGRRTPATVAHDHMIYVAGGHGGESPLHDVECYDCKTKSWATLPSMIKQHDEFGLFFLNDKMFAVGNSEKPHFIEKYDFALKKWEIIAEMPEMEINAQATITAPLPW